MFDEELVIEILSQISSAADTVIKRFEPINSVSVFYSSPEGGEKLDSICMQLIAIGESLKKIDKITSENFLAKYPSIDWKGAKAMRDIISHHYFDVDAEIIYEVCENKISKLKLVIDQMIEDLKSL